MDMLKLSSSSLSSLAQVLYSTEYDTDQVPRRYVHPRSVHVTLRPKRSSPMDRHLAPPISGSWSPGAARAVDGALFLHGPLLVDRTTETEKKSERVDGPWVDATSRHNSVWLKPSSHEYNECINKTICYRLLRQEHTVSN
jgi:hypothetical protein